MSLLFKYGDLIQSILQLFNYISIHFKTVRFDQFKTIPTFCMYRHYNRPSVSPFSFIQIVSAAGYRGNQGIIRISPQTATIKPAPGLIRARDLYVCFQAYSYDPNFVPELIPTAAAHSLAAILPPPVGRTRLIKIRPPSACTVTPSPPTETTSPAIPVPSARALS